MASKRIAWNKGKKGVYTPEQLKRMSETRKGRPSWNKGKAWSKESKQKMSEAHKGKTAWNKGLLGYGKGHIVSAEARRKIGLGHIGKHPSKESIEKAKESRRKTLLDPEVRKRLGESHRGQISWNKGKVMPKEIRQKMYKTTIEQMKELAKSRGGICLSEEYIGSGENLKWECNKGHIWESNPHNIKSGKWCPICLIRTGEKVCRSYFEIFFQEKFPKAHPNWIKGPAGKNLELDGYNENLRLAFEYQGEQHYKPLHYFNRSFGLEKIKRYDNFKKQRCLEKGVVLIQVPYHTDYQKLGKWIEEECKKKGFSPVVNPDKVDFRKFDVYSSKNLEELKEIAKNKGGVCLSKEYINISTALEWRCGKNHIWKTTPQSIKRGTWCPVCDIDRAKHSWKNQFGDASEFQKEELENLKSLTKSRGGKCLSERYTNNATPLQWQCKKGHIWKAKSGNIKNGKWCPKCSYEYRASLRRGNIDEMRQIAESRGGKCLSEKYVNVDTRLRWRCRKEHIWEAVPSSIKRGSWCSKCTKSEARVGKHLSEETK